MFGVTASPDQQAVYCLQERGQRQAQLAHVEAQTAKEGCRFLERRTEDDVLRFSYIVHCALDAIEERVSPAKRPTLSQAADPYLGLLYPTEDYRIYGYISNTKVKLVLVIAMSVNNFKDDELIAVFRRLHAAYVDAVSNPFYTIGQPIASRRFADSVKTAVELFNVSLA